jgi:flavin reductase (DIM6/NTAB) family NADH-FMN oxidoreductase RutF
VTDYCGLVTGRSWDKADLFHVFYGKLERAPLLRECPLNLECSLVRFSPVGGERFIGQVIATYVRQECLTELLGSRPPPGGGVSNREGFPPESMKG